MPIDLQVQENYIIRFFSTIAGSRRYLAHIKEIDTFQEAKKRLSGRQVQAQDDPPGRPPADDARGGKGREGKGAKGEKGDGRKKEGEASSGNNAAK